MRDEEYAPEQIAPYGAGAQPALAARMRPQLRRTQIGNAVAVLGVVAAIVGLAVFPDLFGEFRGRGWGIAAVVCAVLLLGVCTFQHVSWRRAMAVWSGTGRADLRQLFTLSWAAQLVSYLVLAIALWVTIMAVVGLGWFANSSLWLLLALVCLLVAHVLGGVQYVRGTGPPGTVPAHMRRLVERDNARRTP